jgi:hypothetical protein
VKENKLKTGYFRQIFDDIGRSKLEKKKRQREIGKEKKNERLER